MYVCPLCLEGFDRGQLDLLTREHAPPQALDGIVVALTCRTCNHEAGSLQAHSVNEVKWQRFSSGEVGMRHPVQVRGPDGIVVTADIEHRDNAVVILLDPARSNPSHHSRLIDAFNAARTGDVDYTFTLEGDVGFSRDRARAAVLRDAYMAAFSLLGYRYIMWPEFDDVRRQVIEADPDPRVFWRNDQFASDARGILILSQPECVAAISGRRVVLLPWPRKGAELSKWLDESDGTLSGVHGRAYPWPKRMPMLLDFAVARSPQD